MAQKTKNEIITAITELFGKEPTDAQITIMEDISDSMPDDSENWQEKYKQLDKQWRTRYTERFSGKPPAETETEPEPEPEPEPLVFEDLFKGE